jgi:hypothetical protein
VIVLRSPDLLVRLDPRHGAELLDLVDLATGRQLLGRPPFGSADPRGGELDEPVWTASYRGGWQVVAPNAGNACVVDGERHGFHGRASNDPWQVLEQAEAAATLAWTGHGLRLERRYELAEGELRVGTEAAAVDGPAPLVAVEHVSVGVELLEPEVEVELSGGQAYELSETEGPATTPGAAGRWPHVLMHDGTTSVAGRWAIDESQSLYLAVAGLPEGRAAVRNAARDQGLELRWSVDVLPHVWIWHEARMSGGPWRQQAEILAIEPASVPHGLGLATALEQQQAHVVRPGSPLRWTIAARPLHL